MKTMKKKVKRLACLLLALSMLMAETMLVGAAELPEVQTASEEMAETDGEQYVTAVLQIPKARISGTVVEDGVRLYQGPNITTTVIERMYYGETVRIDTITSAAVATGDWYYVMRLRTGTWGWVKAAYVIKI